MIKVKNHFSEIYKTEEAFVVRNPLFPCDHFFQWSDNNNRNTEANKISLEKSLAQFYSQPIAQEALYIASPDLHEQMKQWLDDKIDKEDKKDKIVISLIKYMTRMCTRCTPYGLFASCSTGVISDRTAFQLTDKNEIVRHARLDMDYVGEVLAHLLKQKEITNQLKFYPNTSLYPMGQQLRYVEHRFQENTGRSYHLMQADNSEYLQKILTAAKEGLHPEELAKLLVGDEISSEEAMEFIYEVISSQLLVSEIEPNVTGDEYFVTLLKKLKSCNGAERFIPPFEQVIEDLEKIKTDSSSDKKWIYQNIAENLKPLEIPLHLKTLLQVDSYRPALSYTINKSVINKISEGASLLHLLTSGNAVHDNFSEFKSRFTKRYEGQFIPLVEVLDTESGIGYGKFQTSGMEESPLIQNLPVGEEKENKQPQFEDADVFIWKLYQQAITQNKSEVLIDDKTIEQLSKKELKTDSLPDSVFTIVKIYASSAKEIDAGNYKMTMQSPSGPSGANLLGRFSHLHLEIEKLTKRILSEEEMHHPDCIFAEIVHLPESRIGNILMRPVLREFEIPYLCRSAVDQANQIPVTDLLVGIEGNKVVLISKRLNKKIIPRMTTAHNFSLTTLPIYQFLCDLQYQQISHSGWDWKILINRPFLPRVSYQNIILSKARWTITNEDISHFEKSSDAELLPKFNEFASLKNLPQYVLLSQGDNELMLDLKNIWCLKILLNEIAKFNLISLTETLDTPDNCWIESSDGRHTGEFIFACNKKEIIHEKAPLNHDKGEEAPLSFAKRENERIERYFNVGSEWLYVKIYCGTKTAEKILTEVIKPFTDDLLKEQMIDRFFYVRYADPDHHIRIRFHNTEKKDFWKVVLERFNELIQPYVDEQLIYNVQIETYQRETERYGFETMELSEHLFYYNSAAVLNFISLVYGDAGEQYRWKVALKATDILLDDFGFSTIQKRDLLKWLRDSYVAEFNIGAPQQKKISEKYNNLKKEIYMIMNENYDDADMQQVINPFRIGDPQYYAVITEIKDLADRNISKKLTELMGSYIHMFLNRMFISNQRKHELIIYDFLLKYYVSKIAQEKSQSHTLRAEQIEEV